MVELEHAIKIRKLKLYSLKAAKELSGIPSIDPLI